MKTITYKLKDLEEKKEKKVTLKLGYVGENEHVQIRIDCAEIWKDYPAAVASLAVEPPEGEKYPAIVTRDGDVVCWTVKDSDVAHDGDGRIQLTFTEGSEIQKTVICRTKVDESIIGSGTAPDPIADFVSEANEALAELEAAEVHGPVIGEDGYWYTWSKDAGEYVKTDTKAQGKDGQQGPAGKDGADGAPGQDGHTPVKGTDYWTQQDQADIVAAAALETVSAVIDDTAGDGDTNKTWSADKISETTGQLLTAIQGFEENCVEYILQKKIIVGENQITSESTASGTGWGGSVANGFTHSSGNTDPLIFAVDTVANAVYIVEFDMTSNMEGGISAGIGDSPLADVYNGSEHAFVGFISDGGYLKLYPKSAYTGTVSNIKLRMEVETGTELTHECKNIVNDKNITDISGFWNTAIGPNALQNNQNGTRNIAEGYCALWKLISGNRNIAIGTYAASFITEGENNIAIGADSLYNPSRANLGGKAEGCVAIGKAAMRSGENTVDNVAIGGAAMSECDTNAKENVVIGVRAGFGTGNNNTFIGYRAGYYYTGDSTDNVAIGHDAGFSAYHNSKNCVFIGAEAKANVPGASSSSQKTCNNSIAIGKGAQVTGSFQIVIGNQFYETVKIAGKTIKFNQDGTVTWE